MPPTKPIIKELRLTLAGLVPGNMNRTIKPREGLDLRWHAHGVEVVRGDNVTLVPWASIGSVTSTTKQQKTKQPVTTSESNVAHARTSAGAGRAAASARPAPSR